MENKKMGWRRIYCKLLSLHHFESRKGEFNGSVVVYQLQDGHIILEAEVKNKEKVICYDNKKVLDSSDNRIWHDELAWEREKVSLRFYDEVV